MTTCAGSSASRCRPAGPPPALQAQAVAARTYAITTSVTGNGYTLYPDTRSQMYRGVGAESPPPTRLWRHPRPGGRVPRRARDHLLLLQLGRLHRGHRERVGRRHARALAARRARPFDGADGDPYHRWGADYTLAAAAAKLRGLVKGGLVGIEVLRHGASPRILLADVVGSRGDTQVTGEELQQRFGLPPRWQRSPRSPPSRAAARGWSPVARPGAAGPVHACSARSPPRGCPALHGIVFPGRAGDRFASSSSWPALDDRQSAPARRARQPTWRRCPGRALPDRLSAA